MVLLTNFCSIKIDLSGNTVSSQASVFQKLAKLTNLLNETFSVIFRLSATVSDMGTYAIYGMVHKTMSYIGAQTLVPKHNSTTLLMVLD